MILELLILDTMFKAVELMFLISILLDEVEFIWTANIKE